MIRRRLAIAILITLWCALLAAFLGRYAWPFDLFTHFRVQYTLALLIVAILLFALRAPLLGVAAVAGAVLGAIPIVSYMGVATARAEAGSDRFRLITFNIWFRNHDYAAIGRFLEQAQPDVIVLEELTRKDALRLGEYLHSYPHSFNEPRPHGVVVFARWPIVSAESLALADSPVLAARVTLDWRGTQVTVLGAHLHWPLGPQNSRLRNAELAGRRIVRRRASGAAARRRRFQRHAVVESLSRRARQLGPERLRCGAWPRAIVAVAVPAGGYPHRSLLGVAALAQRRRAARAVAGLGSSAADRGPGAGTADSAYSRCARLRIT